MTFITDQQQDEYARRWMASIIEEQKTPRPTHKGGKPTTWPKYKRLLERHTNLTSCDFAFKLGISVDAATQSLYNYQRKNMVAIVDRIDGISIWGLA